VTAIAAAPAIPWSPRARLPRLLAGIGAARTAGLRDHERHYGPLPVPGPARGRPRGRRPERLIDVVEAAGLTGRGGSGFPVGRKMRSVAAGGGRKAVVANGAEGEPASRKDRLLLSRLPHLVLDGITLAAEAVGADEATCACTERQAPCLTAWTTRWMNDRRPAWIRCRSSWPASPAGTCLASSPSARTADAKAPWPASRLAAPRSTEANQPGSPAVIPEIMSCSPCAVRLAAWTVK